jgi:hypothetical protein
MTRNTALLHEGRRRPMAICAGALVALSVSLAYLQLRPVQQAARSTPTAQTVDPHASVAETWAALEPEIPPQAAPALPPPAAANHTKDRASDPDTDLPYRFIGRSSIQADTAIVLFGRGRVVTLQGPGPVDEEYFVEAVSDDYLLLRHMPTGVGRFVALAPRRQLAQQRDPEESPRD